MSSKKKSSKKSKKSFAKLLSEKLKLSRLGDVQLGSLNDDSASWVSLRIEDAELHFIFDGQGKNFERIGLYKDKVEVTDHIKVWGN